MAALRKLINTSLVRTINETPNIKGDVVVLIHPYEHLSYQKIIMKLIIITKICVN